MSANQLGAYQIVERVEASLHSGGAYDNITDAGDDLIIENSLSKTGDVGVKDSAKAVAARLTLYLARQALPRKQKRTRCSL